MKKYILVVWFYICFYLISLSCNSDIFFQVEGLDSELNFNVQKKLSCIDTNVEYIDEYLREQISYAIRSGLRPLGYYFPDINFFFGLIIQKIWV